MKSTALDPRVDQYIEQAADFARPVLNHLRALIHRASPEIEETIKWRFPFFTHRGKLLCYMGAFKQHCRFGLWGAEMAASLKDHGFETEDSRGSFRRITGIRELPPDQVLLDYLRQSIALADAAAAGPKFSVKPRAKKIELAPPPELLNALEGSSKAKLSFAALSPSCRREYIEWVSQAKRPETRERRIAVTVAQVAEGKNLNWKYAKC